jgi:cell division protein FtsI (penicillin-binding protein 3)
MNPSVIRNAANKRLYFFAGVLLLWCGAIGFRLVQLQIFNYGSWLQRGQRQQQRTIEVSPRRGIIYDRNGQELAMSVTVESIFAVPSEIPDPQTTAGLLARVLGADPREILSRLQSSRTFTWVERKVDAEVSQRIHALNLRGIYFQKESKRFYPKRELAAQVLGWVGMDDEGLGGIEHAFDERLRGHPGKMYITMDARRKWFGRIERQPDPGENIVLTLDEKIQYIAERELDTAIKETHARAGTVLVQNPKTGEILALVNRPTFNPNNLRNVSRDALKNRAVSDIYEPGSTFKVVTLSGALEEKVTTPDEMIDCQNGAIVVNGLRIRDHNPYGLLSVKMVLANSSGVGAIKLGMRIGERRLDHYIQAFNFGKTTGIELPGESRGLKRPLERWSKVSIGALSMGQEIGVTPLQLLSMISSIANDGVWTGPRIVAGFTRPGEGQGGLRNASFESPGENQSSELHNAPRPVVFHPAEQHRAVSTLTAAQMRNMLEGVVLFGTGKKALLNGYTSGGKTGTAQKVDPATGSYSRTDYIGSFAGFAPVNNPAISILVILDSAQGLHQGGQVAAPVFARIAQQVLAYWNVPHDAEFKDVKRQQLHAAVKDSDLVEDAPDRIGDALASSASEQSADLPLLPASRLPKPSLIASSEGREPLPDPLHPAPAVPGSTTGTGAPASLPSSGDNGLVVDVQGGLTVPSLLGKPLRSAVEAAQEAGLEIEALGSGVARDQSPPPGAHVPAGGRILVRFSR